MAEKDVYEHRKLFIDSLFGTADVKEFADILKMSLKEEGFLKDILVVQRPIVQTRFRKLQETGLEAELYFYNISSQFLCLKQGALRMPDCMGMGMIFKS